MAVLEKIAHSTGNGSTENTLATIYNELHRKLIENQNIANDQSDALILENYLNNVIGQSKDLNTIFTLDDGAEIRATVLALQQIIPEMQLPSIVTGKDLEDAYAQIVESTFANAQSAHYIKNLETTSVNTGAERVDLLAGLEDGIKKQVKEAYIAIGNYIKQNIKHESGSSRYQTVQGKIDASGLGFSYDITTKGEKTNISKLLQLLQSSVSLKSYQQANVKVGDKGANFYRTFYSIATAANIPNLDINASFWRMLNCVKYHDSQEVKRYIRRIRLMYELAGIGQHYTKNTVLNEQTMRFIIRYDGRFHVKPISELLSTMLIEDDTPYLSNEAINDIDTLLYGSIHVTV